MMTIRRLTAVSSLIALAALSSGCSRVRGHQGYIGDAVLIDGVKAGIDNRESVQKTLGRPSFASQFGASDWYYVARNTKQLAFALPTPVEQSVIHVRFDRAGNVTAVERTGLEKVARISPNGDKTPTLGRNRGFFSDLFGNIGQVGSVGGGDGGGTADNPN
jgi:outer membrane protein assembly factor BamE (lipoprotein component of BamABCDE complex)